MTAAKGLHISLSISWLAAVLVGVVAFRQLPEFLRSRIVDCLKAGLVPVFMLNSWLQLVVSNPIQQMIGRWRPKRGPGLDTDAAP